MSVLIFGRMVVSIFFKGKSKMKNIWDQDAGEYGLPPLTVQSVKLAEEKLQVTLPSSYTELLKQQNGGYITYNAFPTNIPTSWSENHIHVEHILGIGEENSILDSAYLIEEWDLPKDVVLISGDGHSWVAFDYRKRKENPPVIYIESDDLLIIKLADSFDEFLDGLCLEDEFTEEQDTFNDCKWTNEKLVTVLSSHDIDQIIIGLNYMYLSENIENHIPIIEEFLEKLLCSTNANIRDIAAHYVINFKEKKVLSSDYIQKIFSILASDEHLKTYINVIKKL